MVSVMLCPCILCVPICLGMVVILLFNVMVWLDVLYWKDRVWSSKECVLCLLLLFAFQSMFISIWVFRLEIAELPDIVRRTVPYV